jgi:hypothetical protein
MKAAIKPIFTGRIVVFGKLPNELKIGRKANNFVVLQNHLALKYAKRIQARESLTNDDSIFQADESGNEVVTCFELATSLNAA